MRKRWIAVLVLLAFLSQSAVNANANSSNGSGQEDKTMLLIGQTYQQEYTDYINGTQSVPAGSSHYGEIYTGTINQGDDGKNFDDSAPFLDWVATQYPGSTQLVAISIKDNPGAGGYGHLNPNDPAGYDPSGVYKAVRDIAYTAKWDANIRKLAVKFKQYPATTFLLRIDYEVNMLMLANASGRDFISVLDKYNAQGINIFDDISLADPADIDVKAYHDAYNKIARIIREEEQADNVKFVYHPVRGFGEVKALYPGDEYVDYIGFSVFNHDVSMGTDETGNEAVRTLGYDGSRIDSNLKQSLEWAESRKPIIIAESAYQKAPEEWAAAVGSEHSNAFLEYLDRLLEIVENYHVKVLTYINSDWVGHHWAQHWGDSRVEQNPQVTAYWMEQVVNNPRFIQYRGGSGIPSATPVPTTVPMPTSQPGGPENPGNVITGQYTNGQSKQAEVSLTEAGMYRLELTGGAGTVSQLVSAKLGAAEGGMAAINENQTSSIYFHNVPAGISRLRITALSDSVNLKSVKLYAPTGAEVPIPGTADPTPVPTAAPTPIATSAPTATPVPTTLPENPGGSGSVLTGRYVNGQTKQAEVSLTEAGMYRLDITGDAGTVSQLASAKLGSIDGGMAAINENSISSIYFHNVPAQTLLLQIKSLSNDLKIKTVKLYAPSGREVVIGGTAEVTPTPSPVPTQGPTGTPSPTQPPSQGGRDGIKLFIGQDNDSIDAYVNSQKFDEPMGITLYQSLYTLGGLTSDADWGAGRTNLQEAVNKHVNQDLAIGLSMVEDHNTPNGLTDIVNHVYDQNIDTLGQFIKGIAPREVYLRVGYEFDGPWNHYDPGKYIAAFRYIRNRLEANGVTNVNYVWQACTYVYNMNMAPLMNWYPGDEYVDYVGVSFFFYAEGPKDGSNNSPFLEEALGIARQKGKPVMMAEVSAQYYQLDQNTYHWSNGTYLPTNAGIQMTAEGIWTQYFKNQLFQFVHNNQDVIKVVAWINADWDSQPKWAPPYAEGYWGDTRIETNSYLTQKWNEELSKTIWAKIGTGGEENPGGTPTPIPTPTPMPTPTPSPVPSQPPAPGEKVEGKFTPEDGKTLLAIGQDLGSLAGYRYGDIMPAGYDYSLAAGEGGMPEPGAAVAYISFYNLLQDQYGINYGALGMDNGGNFTNVDTDWGAGPLNAQKTADGWNHSALILAMSITEHWDQNGLTGIAGGLYDANIEKLAAFCKKYPNKKIYLRIGYEFDGRWNGEDITGYGTGNPLPYSGGYHKKAQYIAAWRHIVDRMRAAGVTNVAYVWQGSASLVDDVVDAWFGNSGVVEGTREDISEWYPGDDYVDWIGLSWFIAPDEARNYFHLPEALPNQDDLAQELIDFAKSRPIPKPVMICEAAPQGYDLEISQYDPTAGLVSRASTGYTYEGAATLFTEGLAAAEAAYKSGTWFGNMSAQEAWERWYIPYFNFIRENSDIIRAVTYINADWNSQSKWAYNAGFNGYVEGYWGDSRVESNPILKQKWLNEINDTDFWLLGSFDISAKLSD